MRDVLIITAIMVGIITAIINDELSYQKAQDFTITFTDPTPPKLKESPVAEVKTVQKMPLPPPAPKIIYVKVDKDIEYWETVHSIESESGNDLFKPVDDARGITSCGDTDNYAGHFQLGIAALKDIGCESKRCKIDRCNYDKALAQAKMYDLVLESRYGCKFNEDYLRYSVHQQGCGGMRSLIRASKGKSKLTNWMFKKLARNSKYSRSTLKNWGSKKTALMFLKHWKQKWEINRNKIKVAKL